MVKSSVYPTAVLQPSEAGFPPLFPLVCLLAHARGNEHEHQQDQDHRHRDERGDVDRLDLDRVRHHAQVAVRIFHAVSADQQTMGIDAVGRTGDQRAVILARLDPERRQIRGLHHADLVDLVGERLVEDHHDECVPFFEFIEIGKQLCRGQASVPGQRAVGAFAAHRKGRALQMSDGGLQDLLTGPVVDGQLDIDLGNINVAHDSGGTGREQAVVLFPLLLGQRPVDAVFRDFVVVGSGRLDHLLVLVVVHVGDLFGVVQNGVRLMHGVPVVREGRVNEESQTDGKYAA